jgi:hypothetical protein
MYDKGRVYEGGKINYPASPKAGRRLPKEGGVRLNFFACGAKENKRSDHLVVVDKLVGGQGRGTYPKYKVLQIKNPKYKVSLDSLVWRPNKKPGRALYLGYFYIHIRININQQSNYLLTSLLTIGRANTSSTRGPHT